MLMCTNEYEQSGLYVFFEADDKCNDKFNILKSNSTRNKRYVHPLFLSALSITKHCNL